MENIKVDPYESSLKFYAEMEQHIGLLAKNSGGESGKDQGKMVEEGIKA